MDYTVKFSVTVTADSPEEAGKFALDDLRDTTLSPWNADVQFLRDGVRVEQTVVVEGDNELEQTEHEFPSSGNPPEQGDVYAYQDRVKDDPMIRAWLARVDAARAAMPGVEVEFATTLQDRCEENKVYHDHANQLVSEFLAPRLRWSTDAAETLDEESLPYYRIRFADGVEILADDAELFSIDPRFVEMISAISGAFACARELGYVGPWHLAADGTDQEKAEFLLAYETHQIEVPPKHWASNFNTPDRFRQLFQDEVRKRRYEIAESAWQEYNFGPGVQVTDTGGWEDDGTNDFTRIAYAEFEEGDSDRVSFHVRFAPGSAEVEEVYGLLMSSGNQIGWMAYSCPVEAPAPGM